MFIDNAWKELGKGLGRLRYVNGVIIEHMHPSVRKAKPDAGYERANASWAADEAAFEAWRANVLPANLHALSYVLDVERV